MDTRSLALLALCVAACAEPLSETLEVLEPLEHLVPLQQALKSRSDSFNPYANEFTQEYEPVAIAAIPLGSPMPVVAVLTDNPHHLKQIGPQALATTLKQVFSKPTDYQNYGPDYGKHYDDYQKPHAELPKYTHPYASTEYVKHYSPAEFPKHYSSIEFAKPYPDYPKAYSTVEYAKYPTYATEYPKPYRAVEYTKPFYEEYVKPYAAEASPPTILYARPSENGGYTYSRRPLKKRNVKRPPKPKPMIIRVHKYRVIRSRRSGY